VLTGIATLADPSSGADFALARFNPNGSLDSGFGAGGMLTTDFGDTHDVGLSVVLQPDGKIVVAGGTRHFGVRASNPYDFALARYNANGSLDTSFGAGGHTSTDFGGFDNVATGVALQPDGKIVATGTGFDPGSGSSPPELELARYNTDGSLDPTFDADGRVMLGSAEGSDVAVVRGKIVAAGRSGNNIALFRYDGAGSLDRTFGHDGIAMAILPEYALADELAIQPDGEIVVAGSTASNGGDFAVARFNPDGSVDPAFGARGAATTDLQGNSYEWAGGLVLERDGKIVLAGPTVAPGSPVADFALVRYLGAACVVPNIKQRALAAARKAIAKANCTLGNVRRAFSARVKTGHVISQKPAAGRRLRYGAKVRLVVSRGRR